MNNNDKYGGFMITNSVLHKESLPMYTYREKSSKQQLNGWQIIGDSDTEEYVNNPVNWSIVNADTIMNICPMLLDYFDAEYGTDIALIYEQDVIVGLMDLKTGGDITIEEILK